MSIKSLNADHVRGVYNGFFSDGTKDYAYDRWQRTAESKYQFAQSLRVFSRALKGLSVERALEVGCGDGVWTRVFLPHVSSLICYDISSEMLRRASTKLAGSSPVPEFIEGDFLSNVLPSSSFEALLSFRSFEYFEDKERGLSEFARLLQPQGTLFLVTKSPQYDWKGYFQTKTLHQGVMDILQLRSRLAAQGFEVVDVYPAIVGKMLGTKIGRIVGHLLHWSLILTRTFFPLCISRYITESYLVVARRRG